MHELSIAHSLVEIAEEAAAKAGVARVTVVHLRLGTLSGVVRDALLFGFDVASAGTRLEGARLEIEEVPLQVYCETCDTVVALPDVRYFRCPQCGAACRRIVTGQEIELAALEYEDDTPEATAS
ncbi:hydrogenase maturation nickel metallochaperone HypA [Roseiflexus sp. RS-1]|jgi:hydrogenase nickel insertion protein HypA|uniref:Hydrogenase maturation factor HypA n=1 Tax=Roseiflexus sp. (strain RS-1) TaxID=357808 RepID=HYPA_ROSS1|nr:hydrogenase maturation nickel metallochaperone HypA [Roseiflexus sp. RS-1]A5URX3.1 RecName: Full=Hydrogenase maturation factor HypA [Roseiflexus sp. RS-1]ABQ89376.1 hydrogenase nickel insertion protein HypA [Roseiflexus sp. RS-1]MBO9341606.1 hydrogenase maturation nickel metallochaperone HypA [Roseiflexus sp.]